MGYCKAMQRVRGAIAAAMAVVLAIGMTPVMTTQAYASDELVAASIETQEAEYTHTFTFSETGILVDSTDEVTGKKSGSDGAWSVNKNLKLTISASGTYYLTGSRASATKGISVEASDVTLVLDNFTLAVSESAPITVKAGYNVTIELADGSTNTLIDAEDPANETSSDADVAEAFEGACIKVKKGASATFTGSGTLVIDGSGCKNGIKGGKTSSLTFASGTYRVSAAKNGIAADESVAISGGTFYIDAGNDGIKSVPDADDDESTGTVTITGGTFDIDAGTGNDGGDGICADSKLGVSGGTFDIKTMGGYDDSSFKSDTMSAKGLKASSATDSSSTDSSADASTTSTSNEIAISGGTFTLNTADDAVHSDGSITVTGGTFDIKTGDDGMHADTSLTLGKEGGSDSAVDVKVENSYEGLEGGTVCIYSGTYIVVASDDGVNAAGGSSNGSDPGKGDDIFKPGGPQPGFGGRPSNSASDYNIYVYGGDLYVNCSGDGLDSNGGLYLTGGTQQVYSQSNGDNSALDADGTTLIDGATIFTAGATGVDGTAKASWFGTGQKYVTASKSYSANTVLTAKSGSTPLGTYTLPKAASYVMFSAPSASALTLTKGSSSTPDATDSTSSTMQASADNTNNAESSNKAANTMVVKKAAKTVKAKVVAKAKKTVKAVTVKNAAGTVTYAKTGGSKYLKVNAKTGKITIAKGTPAGTYKVKVKVKASGDSTHEAATKTVTVKIKVK